jgi:hypothetical protein
MATQATISPSHKLIEVEDSIKKIAEESFVNSEDLNQLLISVWEQAISQALSDDFLSEEENALVSYQIRFSLSTEVLNKDGYYSRVVKAEILREVLEGIVPQRLRLGGVIPFNLQKGKTIIWLFQGTSYTGGYSSVSLRIAQGGYYRIGGFRGNLVVTSQITKIDTGILAITNKHIFFIGSTKFFRIP